MDAKDSSQGVDKPESDAPGSEASNGGPVIPEGALVIIPMRNAVLFPGMILPFTIGRKGSVLAAQQAVQNDLPVGILLQRNPEQEAPDPDGPCAGRPLGRASS